VATGLWPVLFGAVSCHGDSPQARGYSRELKRWSAHSASAADFLAHFSALQSTAELMHVGRLAFWSAALLRRFRILWRKLTESDFIIFASERL
jgi:hypothetical protein